MPPRKRGRDLFEELGLLVGAQETNPLQDLGMNPDLARQLIDEDSKGESLQFVASAMFRTLSRLYHPDTGERSNAERFRAIAAAHERIGKAKTDALLRWTRREPSSATVKADKEQSRRENVAIRAAQLVNVNMALGEHPQHFSQLRWAQGVVLRQGSATLLARPSLEGLQVIKGETFAIDKGRLPLSHQTQAFDFQRFLQQHNSFGLESEMRIAAFFDDTGRTTLLHPDLSFMMDITDPVAEYRQIRAKLSRAEKLYTDGSDAWARSTDPGLLRTKVPGPLLLSEAGADFISFPLDRSLTFNRSVPLNVAGSIEDADFFRTIRFSRSTGATALGGRATLPSHFGMASITALQLLESDVQYTPLMAPGNSLLLFDPRNRMPVATDAKIVGMIGNGAQTFINHEA